jgi:hypothetical protein
MTTPKTTRAAAIGFAAAIVAVIASPAWAAPQPNDAQRASNTYPTYQGATGCVQDFGYGRIVEGCD